MCGIAGVHCKVAKNPVKKLQVERFVDQLLLGIENRGKHATGFVAVTNNARDVVHDRAAVTASEYIARRPLLPSNARTILLHTRWATQGTPDVNENNHPVLFRTCYVTHNGHISNDDKVFKSLDLTRNAEVDSEAIAAAISHYGFDKINVALRELEGNYAIATIDPENNPNELILAKGPSSPLYVYEDSNFIVWASEAGVIQRAYRAITGEQPEYKDIDGLFEGDMLWIRGGEVEKLQFAVKERTYNFGFNRAWDKTDTPRVPQTRPTCKGCNHLMEDHPVVFGKRQNNNTMCSGSPRCNCREYKSKLSDRKKDEKKPAVNDTSKCDDCEMVSYIGVGKDRCGVCEHGVLWNMRTGSVQPWPADGDGFTAFEDCECDHTQAFHVGLSSDCEYPGCKCPRYQALGMEEAEVVVKCAGCDEWTDEADAEELLGYDVCPGCYAKFKDDEWLDPGAGKEDSCSVKTLAIAAESESKNSYEVLAREENEMHRYCLDEVAGATGIKQEYVDWLLFRCPMEVYSESPRLMEERKEFDRVYADAEQSWMFAQVR